MYLDKKLFPDLDICYAKSPLINFLMSKIYLFFLWEFSICYYLWCDYKMMVPVRQKQTTVTKFTALGDRKHTILSRTKYHKIGCEARLMAGCWVSCDNNLRLSEGHSPLLWSCDERMAANIAPGHLNQSDTSKIQHPARNIIHTPSSSNLFWLLSGYDI